jgi:hypothetical protein
MERVRPVSGQSKGVDVERPTRVQSSIATKKVMIWVHFSRPGIQGIIALSEKEIFMRRLFTEKMLDDFDKGRAETRPKKRARATFLHLDNAPTHPADDDFDRLGITRLSHLPYRPDLAQCYFWLFRKLTTKLERKTFACAMELMGKVNEILMDIP